MKGFNNERQERVWGGLLPKTFFFNHGAHGNFYWFALFPMILFGSKPMVVNSALLLSGGGDMERRRSRRHSYCGSFLQNTKYLLFFLLLGVDFY